MDRIFSLRKVDLIGLGLQIAILGFFFWKSVQLISQGMSQSHEVWVDYHQYFYVTAFLLGLVAVNAKPNFNFLSLISLLISIVAYEFDVFDGFFHSLFSKGLYDLLGHADFSLNPQYCKLLFYGSAISLQSLLMIKRSYRTLGRVFILLLLTVNLAVVLLNHYMLPSGLLKSFASHIDNRMQAVQSLSDSEIDLLCRIENWECQWLSQGTLPKPDLIDLNLQPRVQRSVLRPDGQTLEMVDIESPKHYWQLSLGYFSMGSFLVSFFWYSSLIFLSLVHRRVDSLTNPNSN